MKWQDIVMVIGQIGFFIALWPALFDRKRKPPPSTCIMTAIILTSYMVCFASLGLKFSPIMQSLVALQWYILFYQGVKK